MNQTQIGYVVVGKLYAWFTQLYLLSIHNWDDLLRDTGILSNDIFERYGLQRRSRWLFHSPSLYFSTGEYARSRVRRWHSHHTTRATGDESGAVVRGSAFTSEFLGSILAMNSCEKSLSTLCRKSWVFSGCSGFLPQGKLTGWVRINTFEKVRSQLL